MYSERHKISPRKTLLSLSDRTLYFRNICVLLVAKHCFVKTFCLRVTENHIWWKFVYSKWQNVILRKTLLSPSDKASYLRNIDVLWVAEHYFEKTFSLWVTEHHIWGTFVYSEWQNIIWRNIFLSPSERTSYSRNICVLWVAEHYFEEIICVRDRTLFLGKYSCLRVTEHYIWGTFVHSKG